MGYRSWCQSSRVRTLTGPKHARTNNYFATNVTGIGTEGIIPNIPKLFPLRSITQTILKLCMYTFKN